MLRWRLPLGAALVAALAGLCWLDARAATPGACLVPLALFVTFLASGEMLWLYRSAKLTARPLVVLVGNLLIVASAWGPVLFSYGPSEVSGPLFAFVLVTLAAFLIEIVAYRRPGGVVSRLALTIFALAYVGLLMAFLILLRLMEGGPIGMVALLALICVVKMGDIGAYTVGRLIGRHKMAPYLSPGKTWEGAAGGLAFALLGSWFALGWLAPRVAPELIVSTRGWIVFGLVVGAAGMIGDLAESLLKRDLGQKDSSPWLPGFGGVLDIMDSLLVAAPVAYLCFRYLMGG